MLSTILQVLTAEKDFGSGHCCREFLLNYSGSNKSNPTIPLLWRAVEYVVDIESVGVALG